MNRSCLRTCAPAIPSVVLPMPGVPISRGVRGRSRSSTTSQQARSCLRISRWPIHSDGAAWGWERCRVTPWICTLFITAYCSHLAAFGSWAGVAFVVVTLFAERRDLEVLLPDLSAFEVALGFHDVRLGLGGFGVLVIDESFAEDAAVHGLF